MTETSESKKCVPFVEKAQTIISLGQAIANMERYIAKLKEKNVESSWIESFETRKKSLENIQEEFLNSNECEIEK